MRRLHVSSIAVMFLMSAAPVVARALGEGAAASRQEASGPVPPAADGAPPSSEPVSATAAPVIAVAPFDAASRDAILAYGIAHGLETRLHTAVEVSALSLGQVSEAMVDLELDERQVTVPAPARQLATELGADLLVTGRLQRERRGIDLQLVFVRGKSTHRRKLQAADPLELERRLADAVAEVLELPRGAFASSGVAGSETDVITLWRGLWLLTRAGVDVDASLAAPRPGSPSSELTAAREALTAVAATADLAEARAGLAMATAWLAAEPAPEVAARTGPEPTATLARVMTALRREGVAAAQQALVDTIAARPGFLLAHALLARSYARQNRLGEAERAYRTYATLAPRHPRVLVAIGELAAKQQRFEEAVATTERALLLAPDSPAVTLELAERYIEAGRIDDAVSQLARIYRERPKDGRIATRLAHAYLLQGKDTAAVNTAESALRWLAPAARDERARAHLTLARAWGRLGQYDVALEQLAAGKKQGLASCSEIEADPRLSRFRADPRYQRLRF